MPDPCSKCRCKRQSKSGLALSDVPSEICKVDRDINVDIVAFPLVRVRGLRGAVVRGLMEERLLFAGRHGRFQQRGPSEGMMSCCHVLIV